MREPLTEARLAELAALEQAATPGPWEAGCVMKESEGRTYLYFSEQIDIGPPSQEEAGLDYQPGGPVAAVSVSEFAGNAELIAAARNALPDLLAWIRAAKKMLAERAGRTEGSIQVCCSACWRTPDRDHAPTCPLAALLRGEVPSE